MKRSLLILSIILTSFLTVKTQTSEPISQLTPVSSNIGKFSKRLPSNNNRLINTDNLKFNVSAEPINLPNNKKGVAITIKTIYNELVFENIGDVPTTNIRIYGRITSRDKITDGFFEEKLSKSVEISVLKKNLTKKQDYTEYLNCLKETIK